MKRQRTKRRLPPLNALRAFEAAARHTSFKRAAEELDVSQSAISHQVRGLEDYLGTHLFSRQIRAVELTRKGSLYYPVVRDALDRIAEATELVVADLAHDTLTIQVYSTFTIRWLLPRLARFQQSNPSLQVRLHTSQTDVNFEQDDIDAAIMIGQPQFSHLTYTHLFDCELFPVCSPAYVEKHGPLGAPIDLSEQPLLQVYPSGSDWHVWLDNHKLQTIRPESGLQFESYDVALSSAVQGMGVALGQQPYVARELDSGALVELFPGKRVLNPNSWYMVSRGEKAELPKTCLFRQWLLSEIADDPALDKLSENARLNQRK